MIGVCTDSNSQIPPELAARYGVEVVPLTVTLDGEAFLEGVDLDADQFWERIETGVTEVATAAPSPGQFGLAYQALAVRGATSVCSIHVSREVSSTYDAARLAAGATTLEVRVVDSGAASFGVSCAVWEAAEAIRAGADLQHAALIAEQVGGRTGNVFVLRTLEVARRGGRLAPGVESFPGGTLPIWSIIGGKMVEVGRANDLESACGAMADYILDSPGSTKRVAVGTADPATEALASALELRLRPARGVADLIRYRIGPSVGAHTGSGTVGAYWYPLG
ncbi:MAG: DegV family protein [Acidimicrobiales bacterium]